MVHTAGRPRTSPETRRSTQRPSDELPTSLPCSTMTLPRRIVMTIQGLGTPAPVAPPQRLVVTGLYRYVRNPIYVAVVSLIFGQGLFFSSVGVLEYGLAVWLGFFAWVPIFEEPRRRGKFGKDYEDYCALAPRWIPRLVGCSPRQKHGQSCLAIDCHCRGL